MQNEFVLKNLVRKLEELTEIELSDFTENFYDLGGNSLSAIEFMSYVASTFKVELTIKDLFEKSIGDIAALINNKT